MTVVLAVLVFVVLAAALFFGFNALWRWISAQQWKPPGAEEAVAVACSALAIAPPLLFWVRGKPYVGDDGVTRYGFRDPWGRDVAGMWVPHRLTIAKGDGQPFSMTALPFELAREARMQRERVRDDREPVNGEAPPELQRLDEIARAALRAWEQEGAPHG